MTKRQAIVILKAMMESESDPKRYQALYLAVKALETMEYVKGEACGGRSMGVIIRGAKMPSTCDICPLVRFQPYTHQVWCNETNEMVALFDRNDEGFEIERPEWCPLFECKSLDQT